MRDKTFEDRLYGAGSVMADSGQVISSAAEVYDEFFLPALFRAWAPRVVTDALLEPGMRVVDVASGTGVLAIEAARVVSEPSRQ